MKKLRWLTHLKAAVLTHVPIPASCWCMGSSYDCEQRYNNLPAIMLRGPEWYIGLVNQKIQALRFMVRQVKLRSLGTSIWYDCSWSNWRSGMREGLKLKAWLPGGASTYLQTLLIYQWMQTLLWKPFGNMFVDGGRWNSMYGIRNLEEFFARESCGFCTPWVCHGLLKRLKHLRQVKVRHRSFTRVNS